LILGVYFRELGVHPVHYCGVEGVDKWSILGGHIKELLKGMILIWEDYY
jgi:hypothetical protein